MDRPKGVAVGALHYGSWAIEFDDRLLTHLQIVIINRLRHGGPLLMSWVDSTAIGGGRRSIWLTNAVPLSFEFSGSRLPAIDQEWLRCLDASAASSTGLIVTDRDGAPLRVGPGDAIHHRVRPAPQLAGRR